ncbi:MAG TPA: DeoR/GlpR family DNA-binding transcription regulator [Microlunatus sp.]
MKDQPAAVTTRQARIVGWLSDEGRIDVMDVAGRLGVAQETVRRDLRTLESDGQLQRVHGGAIPIETDPFPGLTPLPVNNSDDLALATRLWAELPRIGTLLLGAGRLTLALTTAMTSDPPVRHGLTVVTNSLDAAIAAARISKLAVYNIGGSVSPANRAQEGDWALHELERLHVDISLVCPAGISLERGLGQPTPAAAAVSRAEVACGRTVIALGDASYLGAAAFVQFATITEIDRLVLSGRPSAVVVQSFLDRGLDIEVVDSSIEADSVAAQSEIDSDLRTLTHRRT